MKQYFKSPLNIKARATEAPADNLALAALNRLTISGHCWYASYDFNPIQIIANRYNWSF